MYVRVDGKASIQQDEDGVSWESEPTAHEIYLCLQDLLELM